MLSFLFFLFMMILFGKILMFAVKAAWSVGKILFSVVLLPLFLVVLVIEGLLSLAFPILLVVGIIFLLVSHS